MGAIAIAVFSRPPSSLLTLLTNADPSERKLPWLDSDPYAAHQGRPSVAPRFARASLRMTRGACTSLRSRFPRDDARSLRLAALALPSE
jgi:hypothetical protein